MFSKAKKKDADLALMEVDALPAPDTAPVKKANGKNAPRPKPRSTMPGVPSIISGDVVIRGAIESEGEVQFDGEIEGDIRAKGLIIGDGARVAGEVVAEKVRVSGTVEGAIRATRVELAEGALVKGDIMHTALAIEAGAKFEGNVRHSDDPIGQGALTRESRAKPAPVAPAPTPLQDMAADTPEAPEATAADVPNAVLETVGAPAEPMTRKAKARANLR